MESSWDSKNTRAKNLTTPKKSERSNATTAKPSDISLQPATSRLSAKDAENNTASKSVTKPEKKPAAPNASKTALHHTEAARNQREKKKNRGSSTQKHSTTRNLQQKAEIHKTLPVEENNTKAETELQLVRTRLESDHKQAMERMEENLKKMEEGVYVFVASLTLLIKNLEGEQKKTNRSTQDPEPSC